MSRDHASSSHLPARPILIEDTAEAARLLKEGRVGAIPTETSYGLAASLHQPGALKRIFKIKKRPPSKPLLLLISDLSMLEELTPMPLPPAAERIMEAFWPGPLTLLLPAKGGLAAEVTGSTSKVGVRMSSSPVASELVRLTGCPITATSANLSGLPPCFSPDEVISQLKEEPPDFIVSAQVPGGVIPRSEPSTILDCTSEPVRLIRQGAVSQEDLVKAGIPVEPLKGRA